MSHSFIGIHDKSHESRILYMSSGVQQAMGIPAQAMIGRSAYTFLTNDIHTQAYPTSYCGEMDETCVTIMNLNTIKDTGDLVVTRIVIFSCDTCNIIVAMVYPDRPRVEIPTMDIKRPQEVLGHATVSPNSSSVRVAREPRPRACLVLAHSNTTELVLPGGLPAGVVTSPCGPHIIFATNSISRILDVEGDDLVNATFLKLIAPESLVDAAQFLNDVEHNDSVVFANLFFLNRPFDAESVRGRERVEIEIVGAHSNDGAVLLCHRVRLFSGPVVCPKGGQLGAKDWLEDGYLSLAEFLSSDPETSDCPEFYRKNATYI